MTSRQLLAHAWLGQSRGDVSFVMAYQSHDLARWDLLLRVGHFSSWSGEYILSAVVLGPI
jgi:hypothetical protein